MSLTPGLGERMVVGARARRAPGSIDGPRAGAEQRAARDATDKEAATQLFVSPKTIEKHLGSACARVHSSRAG
jgi:hypothetical protein